MSSHVYVATFKFHLGEKVCHEQAPAETFTVTRRWLDVDLPEGQQCFYMLQRDHPLFGNNVAGPVAESELSPVVD